MSPWADALWEGAYSREDLRRLEATPAPVPADQQGLDFPEYGGMLHFNSEGIAACPVCNWRGVATVQDGIISTFCPVCHADDTMPPPEPQRITARNTPCPCGSGVKAKRCPCDEYTV